MPIKYYQIRYAMVECSECGKKGPKGNSDQEAVELAKNEGFFYSGVRGWDPIFLCGECVLKERCPHVNCMKVIAPGEKDCGHHTTHYYCRFVDENGIRCEKENYHSKTFCTDCTGKITRRAVNEEIKRIKSQGHWDDARPVSPVTEKSWNKSNAQLIKEEIERARLQKAETQKSPATG